MNLNTIIIDDFLDKPYLVRDSALSIDIDRPGNYPGFRSFRADLEYEKYVTDKIQSVTRLNIIKYKQDSFQFQICYESDKTWLHHDQTGWAAILYLTPDAPVESGTGIYRHKQSKIFQGPADLDVSKETEWELITMIGNVFNRLVIYNGQLFHRSVIPGFGRDKNTGRLTQVFFFEAENK